MKKWRNIWPFLGAILLAAAQGDWVITPVVMKLVDGFWFQFVLLAVLLNLELFAWYKFWTWFLKMFLPDRQKIRQTIEFAKEIAEELKDRGIVDRIIDFFEENFEWAVNPDRWFVKSLKTGGKIFGHGLMLFLGVEPFIQGGRFAGVILCVKTGFKNGLYSLMIGNCGHILINMGMWNLTFFLWENFKVQLVVALVVLTVFVGLKRYFQKKAKISHSTKDPS